jgi:hypothetical protein
MFSFKFSLFKRPLHGRSPLQGLICKDICCRVFAALLLCLQISPPADKIFTSLSLSNVRFFLSRSPGGGGGVTLFEPQVSLNARETTKSWTFCHWPPSDRAFLGGGGEGVVQRSPEQTFIFQFQNGFYNVLPF